MRAKSLGIALGLVNARPPGRAKFANAPPSGTDKAGKCPPVARGGGGGGGLGAAVIDGCIIARKDLT